MTPTPIDEGTAAYVLEIHRHYDDLRQVVAQAAGLLVLAATGATTAAPDHPMLGAAEQLLERAADAVRHVNVTNGARPHHQHLLQAAAAMEKALSAIRARLGRPGSPAGFDTALVPLRTGYLHLQEAAGALPGFELVSFGQACCSLHTHQRSSS